MNKLLLIAACGALPCLAAAQSTVTPVNKYSWQENTGWMNWADAGATALGVRDNRTFLQGYVWCENIGWLNVGGGLPAGQTSYLNSSGATFGVNISSTGALSGFAWSENAGWVNFSGGALAAPAQPARIDDMSGRLRGYAWGENIGWINLDLPASPQFVQMQCYANCDGSTVAPTLNALDFQCFLLLFQAGDPRANCDRSGVAPTLNALDFSCFLNRYRAGCP